MVQDPKSLTEQVNHGDYGLFSSFTTDTLDIERFQSILSIRHTPCHVCSGHCFDLSVKGIHSSLYSVSTSPSISRATK